MRLDEDTLFIMTKSLLKLGNKLYEWAEDKGVIGEFEWHFWSFRDF